MEEKIELREKKPRSEKQIEAFKKAQEIRKEGLKIKREKIKEIKELKVKDVLTPHIDDIPEEPKVLTKQLPQETPSETEETAEVVYVKKKKPKKKKIVIEESSSSSDEEVVHLRKPRMKYETPKPIENKEIIYRFI